MDINMMALFSGMERSEKHWHELLGEAGLRILNIHGVGPEMESCIEAELA